jgi:hypothetical protein
MKNLIFVSIFMLSCLIANGQCRVGYSFKEISDEYKEKGKVEKTNVGEESAIKVSFPNSIVYHVFTEKQICYATIIRPTSIEKLDSLIENYDKKYKSVVPFVWIAKIGEGQIKIEFKSLTEIGGACFLMSSFEY